MAGRFRDLAMAVVVAGVTLAGAVGVLSDIVWT